MLNNRQINHYAASLATFGKVLAAVVLVVMAIAAMPAQAQTPGTITFAAEVTSGNGSVVPVLTWSTAPTAAGCVASGNPAWAGAKAPAGTETLPAITSSTTYNLSCSWPGDTTATLTWTRPTTNTDGTAYTDPRGFRIYYSQNPADLMTRTPVAIDNPNAAEHVMSSLAPGVWYFVVTAINQRDVQSDPSNQVTKTMTSAVEAVQSIGITVNPVPNPPTNVGVQ